MTRDELKRKIKNKFGTYSQFARIANIDRYYFQKHFLVKNDVPEDVINRLNALCENLNSKPRLVPISKKRLIALRKAIDESGGVIHFCRNNMEYSKDTLFKILSGGYVGVTPTVKKLLDRFNIE